MKINAKKAVLYGCLIFAGAGGAWAIQSLVNGAVADAPQSSAVANADFGGPAIAGLCVLDRQRLFSTSKAGRDANQRYKLLRETAQSQVSNEEAKIVADVKALDAQKSSLSAPQYQERSQLLARQFQELRAKAAARSRELEITRQQAVGQISAAAQPVIKAVYKDHRCGILVDQTAILAGSSAMNVTETVLAGLDGKLTTVALGEMPPAR